MCPTDPPANPISLLNTDRVMCQTMDNWVVCFGWSVLLMMILNERNAKDSSNSKSRPINEVKRTHRRHGNLGEGTSWARQQH